MTRGLGADFEAALAESHLRPVIFFEGQFQSGWLRLWSGEERITWAGHEWTGGGLLLGIGSFSENARIEAAGTKVTISGIPAAHVQAAIIEARQGMPGRIHLGLMDDGGQLAGEPQMLFAGRLDVPTLQDGGEYCTATLDYESRLVDLTRPRELRYTHESQQAIAAGDKAFEYVASLQDRQITWGSA